jgi:hypothetical protein
MKSRLINIAVEGYTDEVVVRKLMTEAGEVFRINACYGKQGKDYLLQNLPRFHHAAQAMPYFVLLDLDDKDECAPILMKKFPNVESGKLIIRIAVREMEAWLLADRENMAQFLGVPVNKIPFRPDDVLNPKQLIVNLARKSKKTRTIIQDMVPSAGSTSKVGKNYTGKIIEFIANHWDVKNAAQHSTSLQKAISAISKFTRQK